MILEKKGFKSQAHLIVPISVLVSGLLVVMPVASAQDAMSSEAAPGAGAGQGGGMQATDTGVAVNGNADGSNINNNENNLSTGNNTNLNVISPYTTGLGVGGTSVMVMPRNPLPMPNAALGRSNFGLQFGLQNNPFLGSSNGSSPLGWFLQAGLTIPFGKVPDVISNAASGNTRAQVMPDSRSNKDVSGKIQPNKERAPVEYRKDVRARITRRPSQDSTMILTGGLSNPSVGTVTDIVEVAPTLIALASSEIYSKPLKMGQRIGTVEPGGEYTYLGHLRSGWVKLQLPSGKIGWTSSTFEYIKTDYKQVDTLSGLPTYNNASNEKMAAHLNSMKASIR
jgi:hypothetical protein